MTTRDVVFLVADSGMAQVLLGLFGRDRFELALGCHRIEVEQRDIVVAPGNDPGVYTTAGALLRPYQRTHRHAVVMLDREWDGTPGAQAIREHLATSLSFWDKKRPPAVIVIEPELEAWVWQDSPKVAEALKCPADFRRILRASGHWPADAAKPTNPKGALTHLRRFHGADRSNAALRRLAGSVSVKHCQDPAFTVLRDTLRGWFPKESA